MKLGKNVVTETMYTDGYFNIRIKKFNNTVQGVTIETSEDYDIYLKSVNKLKDLAELLDGLLRDWDADGKG